MSGMSEVSSGQSDAGPRIIIHETMPGNVHYPGMGRPCPRCKSFFCCSYDFDRHQKVCRDRYWKKSNYDDSEICPSEKEPELKHACQVGGKVHSGLYDYSLSQNGQWLKRRKT